MSANFATQLFPSLSRQTDVTTDFNFFFREGNDFLNPQKILDTAKDSLNRLQGNSFSALNNPDIFGTKPTNGRIQGTMLDLLGDVDNIVRQNTLGASAQVPTTAPNAVQFVNLFPLPPLPPATTPLPAPVPNPLGQNTQPVLFAPGNGVGPLLTPTQAFQPTLLAPTPVFAGSMGFLPTQTGQPLFMPIIFVNIEAPAMAPTPSILPNPTPAPPLAGAETTAPASNTWLALQLSQLTQAVASLQRLMMSYLRINT